MLCLPWFFIAKFTNTIIPIRRAEKRMKEEIAAWQNSISGEETVTG